MLKIIFAASVISVLSITSAYAKGHAQGLGGAGLAGKTLAGFVDDGQKNAGAGDKSAATTYVQSDAVIEAQDGISGKKKTSLPQRTLLAETDLLMVRRPLELPGQLSTRLS